MKSPMKNLFIRSLAIVLLAASAGASLYAREAFAITAQPKVQAFYTDSLATKLLSTDSSLTLVRGTDKEGNTLSGLYGFVIDEGTASQETVIGLAAGTSVTALVRGVSVLNATSTVTLNKLAHARGASVKITTWPSLGVINNELSGVEGIPTQILYDNVVATSSFSRTQELVSKGYVDYLAFNGAGVVNAGTGTRGVVQISTGAQAAVSSGAGSTGALLVLPSSIATSTYNAATAGNVIPVTDSVTKQFSGLFVATSTLYANALPMATGAASTTIQSDGAGKSYWLPAPHLLTASSTQTSNSNGTASTTILSGIVPANTIGALPGTGILHAQVFLNQINLGIAQELYFETGFGNSTTTLTRHGGATFTGASGVFDFTLIPTGATNTQRGFLTFSYGDSNNPTGTTTMTSYLGNYTTDTTISNPFLIVMRSSSTQSASSTGGYLEVKH